MKIFEVLFILLLLVPIAFLMRYLVSGLSRQTPQQSRSSHRDYDKKPTFRALFGRKKRRSEKDKGREEQDTEDAKSAYEQKAREEFTPPARDDSFTPSKTHTELKRTERVPFSEIYGEPRRPQPSASGRNREYSRRPNSQAGARISTYSDAPREGQKNEKTSLRRKFFSRDTVVLRKREVAEAAGGEKKSGNARTEEKRSRQQPSKRQKRKARERSRKRKIKRADNNK